MPRSSIVTTTDMKPASDEAEPRPAAADPHLRHDRRRRGRARPSSRPRRRSPRCACARTRPACSSGPNGMARFAYGGPGGRSGGPSARRGSSRRSRRPTRPDAPVTEVDVVPVGVALLASMTKHQSRAGEQADERRDGGHDPARPASVAARWRTEGRGRRTEITSCTTSQVLRALGRPWRARPGRTGWRIGAGRSPQSSSARDDAPSTISDRHHDEHHPALPPVHDELHHATSSMSFRSSALLSPCFVASAPARAPARAAGPACRPRRARSRLAGGACRPAPRPAGRRRPAAPCACSRRAPRPAPGPAAGGRRSPRGPLAIAARTWAAIWANSGSLDPASTLMSIVLVVSEHIRRRQATVRGARHPGVAPHAEVVLQRPDADPQEHPGPHADDAEVRARPSPRRTPGRLARKARVVDQRRSRKSLPPMRTPSSTKVCAAGIWSSAEHHDGERRRAVHVAVAA